MKIKLSCLTCVLLLTTLAGAFAPGFLFMENIPRQADAVILFVGPGNEARLGEAKQLLKDGYAHYLIIPSTGELLTRDAASGLARIAEQQVRERIFLRIRAVASYKSYYECTHIEALEARRIMDNLGLRSAMLVSSGFHMRRISMIAGRVFDAGKYSISCNPARWQKPYTPAGWLDRERRGIIVSEYLKIAWFLLYGLAGSR